MSGRTARHSRQKREQSEATDVQRMIAFAEGLFRSTVTIGAFIEALAEGMMVIDASGRIIFCNRRLAEMLGYTPSEILGLHHEQLIPERVRPFHREHEREFLRHPGARQMGPFLDIVMLRKDDAELPVEISLGCLDTPLGLLIMILIRDISERKRAEEALRYSESRYRALYLDSPAMIATLDVAGKVISMNPNFLAHLGYTMEELVGRPVLELLHEDDRAALSRQLDVCLSNPFTMHRWQFRKMCKSGEIVWVEEIAQAVYDLHGELTILLVCQDTTQRVKAEEALRKSELKLSKIFHSVPVLIGITTMSEGRCIDANETVLRTFGFSREEIIGKTITELGVWVPPETRQKMLGILNTEGVVRDMEATFRRRDGTTFTGLFSAEPIDFEGERYLLDIVKDISERKLMEEEIERLNADLSARAAELERTNHELEAFNYTVAHDLRNPLTTISGYCQAIRELCRDSLDEQCEQYVDEAYSGTLRMNRQIDTLLNFSRLSQTPLQRERINLSDMARKVAEEFSMAEPGRRVTFHISEGVYAEADSNLVRVVLDNLFGNAWKYTATRQETVIEFGTTNYNGEQACYVRDNGTGFDIGDANKLFNLFERLPGTRDVHGFGIGLNTVARIVRRHGGRVWAEGAPDKGATFYFTLSNGDENS